MISSINISKTLVIKFFSGLIPAVLPPLHIYVLYKFWGQYSRRVDKLYCSCSCWDTVYKGVYESGIASYKHMYFNATNNTTKIWLLTVAYVILLYECFKYEFRLLLSFQLRYFMGFLFLSSLFSHYYSWWMYFNYWNDEFYQQWNHQLFFSLTEIISTFLVLHFSNSKIPVTQKKVFIIVSIALIHIITAGIDQFVKNVFLGQGHTYQVLRDLAFMIPDLFHATLPLIELIKYQRQNSQFYLNELKKGFFCLIIIVSWVIFLINFVT